MKHYKIIACAFSFILTANVYAGDLSLFVNSREVKSDVSPQIINNTVYLPMRSIINELGANIQWDNPNINIVENDKKIICTINDKTAYINGIQIQLKDAPYIYNNHTFINSNDLNTLLNYKISYNPQSSSISVYANDTEEIKGRMHSLNVLDYCIGDGWIYYITLGDNEGFHKMSLDGSEDTIICSLDDINELGGSTAVTSQYVNDGIIYRFQQLRQYDENGNLQDPNPAYYYKLNLLDNKLISFTGEQNKSANEVDNEIKSFSQAYFSNNLDIVKKTLNDTTKASVYPKIISTDSSEFKITWNPQYILDSKDLIPAQIKFIDPESGTYSYLNIGISYISNQWKITNFELK